MASASRSALSRKDRKDAKESNNVFDDYDVVSTGPSRKLGGKDNMTIADARVANQFGWMGNAWWMQERLALEGAAFDDRQVFRFAREDRVNKLMERNPQIPMPMAAGDKGGGGLPGKSEPTGAVNISSTGRADGGAAPATRVREYFPETMLWQPALITDDKGIADLALSFADSITTWRLSASANSRGGAIGGATVPLKVFQDFFVDIDLPIHLTQTDEIAFPVAVYNYLKTAQTVKIELQKESWFQLLDADGYTRTLNLKANEVTSVKFRIRAGKIGYQPLTVKAYGSKKSDAVKRSVEVVPNGQKIERVLSDRLKGNISHTLDIPANAHLARCVETLMVPHVSRRDGPGRGWSRWHDAHAGGLLRADLLVGVPERFDR